MPQSHKLSSEQIASAVSRYIAGEQSKVIAADLNVRPGSLSYHFRKAGVPKPQEKTARTVCENCNREFTYICSWNTHRPRRYCSRACKGDGYRGETHWHWKEGGSMSYGYRMIRAPKGSISASRPHPNRLMPEHVYIAECALGRRMRPHEVIHHIDGDKANNTRSNLLVCTKSYHNALHSRMSCLYQREKFGKAA